MYHDLAICSGTLTASYSCHEHMYNMYVVTDLWDLLKGAILVCDLLKEGRDIPYD